jgi:hypothetical protein
VTIFINVPSRDSALCGMLVAIERGEWIKDLEGEE